MDTAIVDVSVDQQLDQEIADLQHHIESLKKQVKIQTTNLLSAESTRQVLSSASGLPYEANPASGADAKLITRLGAQEAHDQLNLYRMGAGITSFKVRDPDPNAVDEGRVLGLRFEVMAKARFLRPYYVMLNRPYPDSRHLRVHRHTVPSCIPLAGLAGRHLPPPSEFSGVEVVAEQRVQDLPRFARELRREIVRYHNRAGVIGEMGRAADEAIADSQMEAGDLVSVTAADAQAKHVELGWADGRTGRLVMNDDGEIEKMVVYREETRDWQTQRELLGTSQHVEDVVKLLRLRSQTEVEEG